MYTILTSEWMEMNDNEQCSLPAAVL